VYVLAQTEDTLVEQFRIVAEDMYSSTGIRLALKATDGRVKERFVPASPGGEVAAHVDGVDRKLVLDLPSQDSQLTHYISQRDINEDSDAHANYQGDRRAKLPKLDVTHWSRLAPGNWYSFPTAAPMDLLRRLHMAGMNCIPWCCLVLCPELAHTVDLVALASTPGPHRYNAIAHIIADEVMMAPAGIISLMSNEGDYLKHEDAQHGGGVGHCVAIRLLGSQFYGIVPDSEGAPRTRPVPAAELVGHRFLQLLAKGDVVIHILFPR
jgi:hypothetical protein